MVDTATGALIERKLVLLITYLDELRPLVEGSPKTPVSGNVARRAIERLVQLIVEVTADTNDLLVVALGGPQPQTTRDGFRAMASANVLSEPLTSRFIASYVGLRNRIVHDYDVLNPHLVEQAASRLLKDASEYGAQVKAWIETTGTQKQADE
ncbi:MAG: DUF86 domain-containing protein [Deltaproteobacteria bacterium]|nr:DUF86 domain-containing protein [Deltaproteobacteria bacterium]